MGRAPLKACAAATLAIAVVLLSASVPSAAPDGRVTIRGVASGTHLRLGLSGDALEVTGPMAGASEQCRFVEGRNVARCSLRNASGIEVVTGPSGDMVEVLEKLPLPLTVYLGSGSDKFIGGGERDVCYPQGSRRNRCIGRGGNDVCISGPRNTDCVGGRGNDYCKTSTGSDGCWGGPGRDVCLMGPGQDGCHGDAGNDRLYGGPDPDQLYGGGGRDYCQGLPGVGRQHSCETSPRRLAASGQAGTTGGTDFRAHVFPVRGPHWERGWIGEFGAPRSGGRTHEGFDLPAPCGTPLVAVRSGHILRAGFDPVLYGNYLLLHGQGERRSYFYAHMPRPAAVRRGGRVFAGQRIGSVGMTGNARTVGCHLHFEIHVRGEPIDPEPLLRLWDRA